MSRRARLLLPPAVALGGIALGALLWAFGLRSAGDAVWGVTVATMLAPLSWSVLRALLRADIGVDVIALLAMAGALALGEYLAGAVITLMLAGGNALEAFASARAEYELTALIQRAPRVAPRRSAEGWRQVDVDRVKVGDLLLVRAGEVVPTDGVVESERAVIDESSLTGEPLPATYAHGEAVRSGTANAGDPFELRARERAADSAYAALVQLVQEAQRRRAPFVRMADRYAALFLPVTLAIAAAAWAIGGDPVRALAVLVVATPCPLILAAPIAFMGGLSRAASRGIIVKDGAAIERLGQAKTVLLDKTGTLTLGAPGIARIASFDGLPEGELLRLAASLDQLSGHVLAAAIVSEARRRRLRLAVAEQVRERAGEGIRGTVEGRAVVLGSAAWMRANGLQEACSADLGRAPGDGRAEVLVGVDGRLAGAILMSDRLRPEAQGLTARLRASGVRHVAMVSGDRRQIAEVLGSQLGLDRVYSEQSPAEKVEVVRRVRESEELCPVVMVGDGVNDAPALASADVGVAMGSAGATVSSETADAVIMVDRVDRVADAIAIGTRTVRIARESVLSGIGLSVCGMALAAAGLLVPVTGALAQEAIDVAVILNALRALGEGRGAGAASGAQARPRGRQHGGSHSWTSVRPA
jgi:heavy metal translocating P-type ATPase